MQLLYMSIVSEMLAQCQMVWMLLSMSLGWTLGSPTAHPIRDRRQLSTISVVALIHLLLVFWEQTYDENHYTYHVHESFPGLLLALFRVGLAVLFGYNLQKTMTTERSALRKDFYQSFAIVSQIFDCCQILIIYWCFAFAGLLSVVSLLSIPHAHCHDLCRVPETQGMCKSFCIVIQSYLHFVLMYVVPLL